MTSASATDLPSYSSLVGRRILILCIAAFLLCVSFFIDITNGPGKFPNATILEILFDKASHGLRMEVIVWDFRLPIAVTAVLVGAMLSIAGAQMQTILTTPWQNPLRWAYHLPQALELRSPSFLAGALFPMSDI